MARASKINSSKAEFSDLNWKKKIRHVRAYNFNEDRNILGHKGNQKEAILQL